MCAKSIQISHVQGKRRSPSKMVGGAKSCLESNPVPARDRGLKHTLCAPGPGHPTETKTELCLDINCVEEVWLSSGLPQEQGLWVQ